MFRQKTHHLYRKQLSKPTTHKHRRQLKRFIDLQNYVKEDFEDIPDFLPALEQGLLAMDTLTCLAAVRSNADEFAKYLALTLYGVKGGWPSSLL